MRTYRCTTCDTEGHNAQLCPVTYPELRALPRNWPRWKRSVEARRLRGLCLRCGVEAPEEGRANCRGCLTEKNGTYRPRARAA